MEQIFIDHPIIVIFFLMRDASLGNDIESLQVQVRLPFILLA